MRAREIRQKRKDSVRSKRLGQNNAAGNESSTEYGLLLRKPVNERKTRGNKAFLLRPRLFENLEGYSVRSKSIAGFVALDSDVRGCFSVTFMVKPLGTIMVVQFIT